MKEDRYSIVAPRPEDHPGIDLDGVYEIHHDGARMLTVTVDPAFNTFKVSDLVTMLNREDRAAATAGTVSG